MGCLERIFDPRFLGLNIFFATARDFLPLRRTIPRPPIPTGVEIAMIVSSSIRHILILEKETVKVKICGPKPRKKKNTMAV
jgi:hypothetical protein